MTKQGTTSDYITHNMTFLKLAEKMRPTYTKIPKRSPAIKCTEMSPEKSGEMISIVHVANIGGRHYFRVKKYYTIAKLPQRNTRFQITLWSISKMATRRRLGTRLNTHRQEVALPKMLYPPKGGYIYRHCHTLAEGGTGSSSFANERALTLL